MSLEIAEMIIDQIFEYANNKEIVDVGFFGGEPLLNYSLIKDIVDIIENHPQYCEHIIALDVVTNGTIFSDEIAEFLRHHQITFCVSCDGPPHIQDAFRKHPNGSGSSILVEGTIKRALQLLPNVLVNAVFHPRTFRSLIEVVEYFSSLGIRQIYLSPDFSASWSYNDSALLAKIYHDLAIMYVDYYRQDDPHYINIIDSKILLLLKGGYSDGERCKMGCKEFAFAPSGNIYPCERLIGAGDVNQHCIGHISKGLSKVKQCRSQSNILSNQKCRECSLSNYCMNWCGCSNYFSSGTYDQCGPFICASEKAAIAAATDALRQLEQELGAKYMDSLLTFISNRFCMDERNGTDICACSSVPEYAVGNRSPIVSP